jgi:RNA polymerase sigma factor (sigma-70 family)
MATGRTSELIEALHKVACPPAGEEPTDRQLLDTFLDRRDSAALEAILRRHGAMVWGVCRRVLRNDHDAEDAFQAALLVFVRKAGSIASREHLANYLYGLAHLTARKARQTVAKRRAREIQVTQLPEPQSAPPDRNPWLDLQALLDETLSRLPDKYRAVVVLCDLEGRTRAEAARQLGVAEGTVGSRLARARAQLAERLARHVPAVSGVMLAAVLSERTAAASLPAPVLSAATKAANLLAAGETGAGFISARVFALTQGVLKAMLLAKLRSGVLLMLVGIALAVGAGLLASAAHTQPPVPEPFAKVRKEAQEALVRAGPDEPGKLSPKLHATLEGHTDRVWCVAFNSDRKTLASASRDKTIKLWDAATGKEKTTLKGHTGTIFAVAFSPDGKTIASAGLRPTEQPDGGEEGDPYTEEIRLWDVASGKNTATLEGPAGLVNAVAFSPDGKTLASGSLRFGKKPDEFSGAVVLWDVARGKPVATLEGHTNTVFSVAFSPDGKILASGSGDKTVKLWDVATGKERVTLKDHDDDVTSVAFGTDGKTLVSGSHDNTVKVWDVATNKTVTTIDVETWVLNLALAPDGKTLATGDVSGAVQLWDVGTGKELATLEGHTDHVCTVAFSPDGKTLASGSHDKTVKLWQLVRERKKE